MLPAIMRTHCNPNLQCVFGTDVYATHNQIIHDTLIYELIIHKIKVQYEIFYMIKV